MSKILGRFRSGFGVLFLSVLWTGPGIAGEIVVPATVVSVYDGDTVKVDALPWPGISIRVNVRIEGIDTPEIRGKCKQEKEMALLARDTVSELVKDGIVILEGVHIGKYAGRVIARIILPDGRDVGKELLNLGLAREYDGKGARQGWCDD